MAEEKNKSFDFLLGTDVRLSERLIRKIENAYTEEGTGINVEPLLKELGYFVENDTSIRYGRNSNNFVKASSGNLSKFAEYMSEKIQKAILGEEFSYCGSGTDVIGNLKAGKKPINYVDFHCMLHDIAYFIISSLPEDKISQSVNSADKLLLNETLNIANDEKIDKKTRDQAEAVASAMKVKMKTVSPFNFISKSKVLSKNDKKELTKQILDKYATLVKEYEKNDNLESIVDDESFITNVETLVEIRNKEKNELLYSGKDRVKFDEIFNEIYDSLESQGDKDEYEGMIRFVKQQPSFLSSISEIPEEEQIGLGPAEAEEEERKEETTGRAPAVDPEDPELEELEEIVRQVTGTTPEEEAERLIDPSDPVKETPVDVSAVIGERPRAGQEERVDLNADPPMSAMELTDAKPVVGERNMRPTLFREEGDTVELSNRQEQENRLFYENFTWIDAGFGNGNIQRLPNEIYAGRDIANNRLYTAQVKNEMLKYSGNLFVGDQQHRKKYNISANTRNLVRRPMHSTVQHHQQFIRDSSLPAGAGRKHQMARDNPSWIPSKNVNSRVGHLYYPDVVDGKRI